MILKPAKTSQELTHWLGFSGTTEWEPGIQPQSPAVLPDQSPDPISFSSHAAPSRNCDKAGCPSSWQIAPRKGTFNFLWNPRRTRVPVPQLAARPVPAFPVLGGSGLRSPDALTRRLSLSMVSQGLKPPDSAGVEGKLHVGLWRPRHVGKKGAGIEGRPPAAGRGSWLGHVK